MIDFSKIEQYRENNRIEAKKALGGLPKSIWETYSAFANTYGGIILLGVEERADKSFHVVDLPDPDRLIQEFWEIVNNPNRTSVNVLSSQDVFVQNINGKHIVVINVPRAERTDKPVYVDGSPLGTYRRNGEGDYRCTQEEYQAMVRDASVKTQDRRLLPKLDLSVLHAQSIQSYRERMHRSRPGHVWEALDTKPFLEKLGAVGVDSDGAPHPTAAGLLMFGTEPAIVQAFPDYRLDYREDEDPTVPGTHRVLSSSGDWSGNVYEFYFRVYDKLIQNLPVPSQRSDGGETGPAPVQQALREALANCLVNADYYGRQGLVIRKTRDAITMANPGGFRIGIDAAKSGGVSDPRNETMRNMFHLIEIGQRTGSGIPTIFRVWRAQGWDLPIIREQLDPARTQLTLTFQPSQNNLEIIRPETSSGAIRPRMKETILIYLTDHSQAKASELGAYMGLTPSRTQDYLQELVKEGSVVADEGHPDPVYRLKS